MKRRQTEYNLKKYNLLTPPLKIDKLDLVLCIGVLHHIDDIYAACRNLFSLTNDLVVIECMVLPESLNNEDALNNTLAYPLKEAREQFETKYLTNQLKKNNGNISKTADFIGMERSALHRKLKSLGIKGLN